MSNFKKVLSVVLACLFFSLSITPSFASSTNYGPSEVVDFDEVEASKVGDEYIKNGSMLKYARASKYLTISKYSQKDPAWSNDIMYTSGDTIGAAGCGVCSLAMIFRNSNIFQNPKQLNSTIGNNASPLMYAGAGAPYLMAVLANKTNPTEDEAIDFIVGSITDNKPVLVYMKQSTTSKSYTHFVAAYGYTSGGVIAINDPEPGWNYQTLNTYLDKGWTITRMVTYVKTN